MENPIALMYSWQALLVAIACVGITKLVKTTIETVYLSRAGKLTAKDEDAIRKQLVDQGYEGHTFLSRRLSDRELAHAMRKGNVVITRFVLPMVPIVVGVLIASFIPVWPDPLREAVADMDWWSARGVVGLWGGACGQFADYLFSKAKAALKDLTK